MRAIIGWADRSNLWWRRNATAVPPAFDTRGASLIPKSEVILLDAGHFLPMSESAVIARELVRLFSANRGLETQWPASAAD